KRAPAAGEIPGSRDAESFLQFLRSAAGGEAAPEATWEAPVASREKWANIGGREPGPCSDGTPCLFRWYWGTSNQPSPNAVLSATGTQSNLIDDEPVCGTDSLCDVGNAASGWHGVADSDVRLSGPSTPGNIQVQLDSTQSQDGGATWSTALGCTGGVIGLGGPSTV